MEFAETITVFPALERLELSNMPNLVEWSEVELPDGAEVVVFPHLEHLRIEICEELMSAPSHFPCLKELDIGEMQSSLPLASICGKLVSLTKLAIDGINELVSLPNRLFYNNNQTLSELTIFSCPNSTPFGGGGASLKELHIYGCSNLIELPDDLLALSSLKKLRIEECENLKSIPYPSGGQPQCSTSLHTLCISDSQELINSPSELVESCAPSLESLSLERLGSLTNLPALIACLHRMPRLTQLRIAHVPTFTSSVAEIGPLCSLEELTVGATADADYVSINKALDGIFRGSKSLCDLTLFGMEDWDALPDQIQNLTALSMLSTRGLGVEALPEWFGKLSSLETLFLFDCEKLRHLPSMEAMPGLKRLTRLHINNCPLLCIEQQTDADDSEWAKISHIRRVYVDGSRVRTRKNK